MSIMYTQDLSSCLSHVQACTGHAPATASLLTLAVTVLAREYWTLPSLSTTHTYGLGVHPRVIQDRTAYRQVEAAPLPEDLPRDLAALGAAPQAARPLEIPQLLRDAVPIEQQLKALQSWS